MSEQNSVTFREVQRMRRVWWVMLLIAGIAAMTWYTFVQQIILGHPVGTNPGSDWSVWLIWLVFGIGFPAGFIIMRLVVEVREDQINIRYVPFLRRRIPFADIEKYQARTYSPISEYGGWGIKGWHRDRISYSISGNLGVELELKTGKWVMIGSRRADELADAIGARMAQTQRPQ